MLSEYTKAYCPTVEDHSSGFSQERALEKASLFLQSAANAGTLKGNSPRIKV